MTFIPECPTCGEIMPRANHQCPPAWLVRAEGDPESEGRLIYDWNDAGAAEKYCLWADDGEPHPRHHKVLVEAKPKPGGIALLPEPKLFEMRGELVPQYLPF